MRVPFRYSLSAAFAVALAYCVPMSMRSQAQEPTSQNTFQLSPGVLINLAANQAYLASSDDSISAVNISDGSIAWKSNDAARPVAAGNGLLVGQAQPPPRSNSLRLVVLSTTENGKAVANQNVNLPGVIPVVGSTAGASFDVSGHIQNDSLAVTWSAAVRPVSGARPPPPHRQDGGASAPAPAAAVQGPGGGNPMQGSISFEIDKSGKMSHEIQGEQAAPMNAPANFAAPAAPAAAVPGEPKDQFISADGSAILISERISDDWDKYRWKIIARKTKEPLGQLLSPVRFAPFFVTNNQLVYESSPYSRKTADGKIEQQPTKQLRAVDLKTGATNWNQPIRDLTPHGPFPP